MLAINKQKKLAHVFIGALIDRNNIIRDLLECAFPGNVANKPCERTNTHNSDENENTNVID